MRANRIRMRPGDGDSRHGTLAGYTNHRCRCVGCRSAIATYHRERYRRVRVPKDHLKVTCWCELAIVWVSASDVFEGRTQSCGRAACQAPATESAA